MNQRLKRSSLATIALMILAFISGCKDTAPDPGYNDFGSIRVMEYVKCTPVKIDLIMVGGDTTRLTPTAMTYGTVLPYTTNLSTAQGAGQVYHLIATIGSARLEQDIKLMPGDKKTWVIFDTQAGVYNTKVTSENPTSTPDKSLAYFRFINVQPGSTLSLRVDDALAGTPIAIDKAFQDVSDYVGLPTRQDTTVTFLVVDNNTIVGRLSGQPLAGGTFRTITFGGEAQDCRIPDKTSGELTNVDTVRIRVIDDNIQGNEVLPVPSTLRFNVINAMIPPTFPTATLTDFRPEGVSLVINNNNVYDFADIPMFTGVPHHDPIDNIQQVYPKSVPLTPQVFIKAVKRIGSDPSPADPILIRFFANSQVIKSDQLVSIVLFDTVRPYRATDKYPFDSAFGVATVAVPDQAVSGAAVILIGNMMPSAARGTSGPTGSAQKFTVDGQDAPKATKSKSYDVVTVQTDGSRDIEVTGYVKFGSDEQTFRGTFRPQPGGIYEAFLVGRYNDPPRADGSTYPPRFIFIRTNPIAP